MQPLFLFVNRMLIQCLVLFSLLACPPTEQFNYAPANARILHSFQLDQLIAINEADYLDESLRNLEQWSVEWYNYVTSASPIILSYRPELLAQGRSAVSQCCDADGRGHIQVGYPFSEVTGPPANSFSTPEAKRLGLLNLLVHEVTHVRDMRAKTYDTLDEPRRCIAVERHAFQMQLSFWQALNQLEFSPDKETMQNYRVVIIRQVASQPRLLSNPHFWQYYCGNR